MRDPSCTAPSIVVFRGIIAVPSDERREIDFSADERCQLYLDGERIAEGPERGCPGRWYRRSVTLPLSAGTHVLCARVLCIGGDLRFYGQLTMGYGFGIRNLDGAQWSFQTEKLAFEEPFPDWAAFPRVKVLPGYNAGILKGEGGIWKKVEFYEDRRVLHAPDLPDMDYVPVVPEKLREGLWRFQGYVCAYAVYHFSGRGRVKIRWSECPYDDEIFDPLLLKGHKGRRDGKVFHSNWDEFAVDGEFSWPTPLWRAGRYVEVVTEGTASFSAEYFRTGYPLPEYASEEPLMRAAYETLRNCCFETFMDCPFYEQLMYVGDSRIEALILYRLGADRRLPAKALRIWATSRQQDGSIFSHYPTKGHQRITSFMLIWFLMLHDYVSRFPEDGLQDELREVADGLMAYLDGTCRNGLMEPDPECWNFIDWCSGWDNGVPPGNGPCCMLNEFYVLALRAYGKIYSLEEPVRRANELARRIEREFICSDTGLLKNLPDRDEFCEQAQVLALLCGIGNPERIAAGLRNVPMTQCSIYFSYYYFEACRKFNLKELEEKRLDKYRALLKNGLETLPEEFENPRSDCHAWSAHVLLLDKNGEDNRNR